MQYKIVVADYLDNQHAHHIRQLMDLYARDLMGGGQGLSASVLSKLPKALSQVPGAFSVLSYADDQPAGLINCLEGFSTFACQALINIHDVIVDSEYRGHGLSRLMLEKVEQIAVQRGCCKLTLEVLSGNLPAKALYQGFGFTHYQLNKQTGSAEFWEKQILAKSPANE